MFGVRCTVPRMTVLVTVFVVLLLAGICTLMEWETF